MSSEKLVDTHVYNLAEMFLSDHPQLDNPDNRQDLAAAIQTVIEDWIWGREHGEE